MRLLEGVGRRPEWTRKGKSVVAGAALSLLVVTMAPGMLSACTGDCSADGDVTVDEIVLAVQMALGARELSACSAADRSGDGTVTVDEILAAVAAALDGCPVAPSPTPTVLPAVLAFVDVATEAGLVYRHHGTEPNDMFAGGGAAARDYDGDGWVDLFVTRLESPGILFRNRGDGTFVDVTAEVGLDAIDARINGAAWGDVDNDGDPDLYLTANGPFEFRHYLFINHGDEGFREEALARGAAVAGEDKHFGYSATFGDYDRDGWLDLHVTEWRIDLDNRDNAPANIRLLRNRGAAAPGSFVDVTDAAGVSYDGIPDIDPKINGTWAFTSRFADLDDDGWPDLVVAADYGTSRIFWNRGDGTFAASGTEIGIATDENGMGSAIGDFDGDGRLDWFVSSIFDPDARCTGPQVACSWGNTGNRLFRNLGGRQFADVTDQAGVRDGYWGWGSAFFDGDNDGDLDLVQANGLRLPFEDPFGVTGRFQNDPIRLWRNDGGVMTELSATAGMTSVESGKGLLVFDYDRDGDLDVFVANNEGAPHLYRNEGTGAGAYLRVDVEGRDSNRDGVGARVRVRVTESGLPQLREINAGSHFLGQSETTAHFGLGDNVDTVHSVEVEWPATGRRVVLRGVPANRSLRVTEPTR